MSKHALLFGASSISGWALVDRILNAAPSTENAFGRVTALMNRKMEQTQWPSDSKVKLQVVDQVDLAQDASIEKLEKVDDIASVTHAYYFVFKPDHDPRKEIKENGAMLARALLALERFCPKLEHLVFCGGTKRYGLMFPELPLATPFRESAGRMAEPYASQTWYYHAEDLIEKHQQGKSWKWCELNPDVIVGFTPNGSLFNLAAHWGNFLSIYRAVNGKGAEVYFPGSPEGYKSLYNEVSAETIADFSLWAGLHPENSGNAQNYNVAESSTPSSMEQVWPRLAAYWGLKGVGPDVNNKEMFRVSQYVEEHKEVRAGLDDNSVFSGYMMDYIGFMPQNRHMSLEKGRQAGFSKETDPVTAWLNAFDKFVRVGKLPKNDKL